VGEGFERVNKIDGQENYLDGGSCLLGVKAGTTNATEVEVYVIIS